MSVFGRVYADAYDALYREKAYADECDMIEAMIAEFGQVHPVRRLLDLGCGTGNHAIPLAARGYRVTGIDRAPSMLARAREKAAAVGVNDVVDFREGDVRVMRLGGESFDAAIMMFAVLGYQRTDDDVRAALLTAREHLRVGAMFIFDFWHGPGVLADKPGSRDRIVPTADGCISRHAASETDETSNVCTVRYDLERRTADEVVESVREEHQMRFFFPEEIQGFAIGAGFEHCTERGLPNWRLPPDERAWTAVSAFRVV